MQHMYASFCSDTENVLRAYWMIAGHAGSTGDGPLIVLPFLLGQNKTTGQWRLAVNVASFQDHLEGKVQPHRLYSSPHSSEIAFGLDFRFVFSLSPHDLELKNFLQWQSFFDNWPTWNCLGLSSGLEWRIKRQRSCRNRVHGAQRIAFKYEWGRDFYCWPGCCFKPMALSKSPLESKTPVPSHVLAYWQNPEQLSYQCIWIWGWRDPRREPKSA